MNSLIKYAHAAIDDRAFGKVVDPIIDHIVNPLIGLLFAVALVVFAFGVLQMVMKGDDADARKKGQMSMLGGVIGMFIMMSAWGIIYLISDTIKTL